MIFAVKNQTENCKDKKYRAHSCVIAVERFLSPITGNLLSAQLRIFVAVVNFALQSAGKMRDKEIQNFARCKRPFCGVLKTYAAGFFCGFGFFAEFKRISAARGKFCIFVRRKKRLRRSHKSQAERDRKHHDKMSEILVFLIEQQFHRRINVKEEDEKNSVKNNLKMMRSV